MITAFSRIAAFALCALPWLAVLGFARRGDPSTWTASELASWRDDQIARILTPTFETGNGKILVRREVTARSAEAYDFLVESLANPEFLASPERASILGNFVKFIKGQHWMALKFPNGTQSHGLAMDISDAEYWPYAEPYTTLPEFLRSQSFLALMSNRGTYKYAVNAINEHNATLSGGRKWIVLPFRGQFIASVDQTTFARLLIVAPNQPLPDGRLLDQWVSFAIARPEMNPEPAIRSVSVIAVVRDHDRSGPSQAYFTDYYRERDGESNSIKLNPTFLVNPIPSHNCYDCHKSAVIPIRPKSAYRFDSDGQLMETAPNSVLLASLDKLIQSYGESRIGHLDPSAFGPTLGTPGRSRTDEFIARATMDQAIPMSSYNAIRANMNCASCHENFASLNYGISVRSDSDVKSFEAKQGIVQSFIEQGFMPPGNNMTPTERHALWECVMKEYLDPATGTGTFVDWLRGDDVSGKASQVDP